MWTGSWLRNRHGLFGHWCTCRRREGIGYANQWRAAYRFGLCTYRRGPGFVRIRDVRPDGDHVRVIIDGPWATAFEALLACTVDSSGRAGRLLADLVDAGLAMHVSTGHHVLATRLRQWPIPFSALP